MTDPSVTDRVEATPPRTSFHRSAPLPPGLVLGLHHVGVVVADLEVALTGYAGLGFGGAEWVELPEQRVIAATFRAGSGFVELIQPTDPDGPIARFLAKRGEGLHHVAYEVPDLGIALDGLVAAGVRLIDEVPRVGAHGWRIAFVHPDSCHGVLTELVETAPAEGGHRGG